ncbi:hypothetical protein [Undibacterium terreum]|uniref:Meckel syndrome type 1 protein n=1 Tax=Undibacterium terreum TaxID=1224302 RepID=A0A916UDE9_9BURK|nr:hypothetical protein [Undibacterium terreum]GGC67791.1 hypothetical protein GCM10011396_13520 [Undibacterium terreum]
MSSKEIHHDDDADFEAFLLGQGDLAAHLQALPQASPSPELDQAIFAKVEAAMQQGMPAPMLAANDPVIPERQAAKPVAGRAPFTRRWSAPLATAASVAVVGFLGMQWRHQLELDVPVPAPAVHSEAPVVTEQVARQQSTQVSRPEPTSPPLQAKATVPAAQELPAPSQVVQASQPPAPVASAARQKTTQRPQEPEVLLPATLPPIAAAKPAPAPAQAAAPGWATGGTSDRDISTAGQLADKANGTTRVEITGSSIKREAAAPESTALAKKESASPVQSLPPQAFAPAPVPPPAPAPAPAAVAAYAPAPAMAKPAAPATSLALNEQNEQYARRAVVVDARKIASPQNDEATLFNKKQVREANEWLAVIEELLKADLRRDATAEWKKFRKAYPDYPVPDTVSEQFKTPQK